MTLALPTLSFLQIKEPLFVQLHMFHPFCLIFQKGIHLSIIAPRKIPALQRVFERVSTDFSNLHVLTVI